MNTKKPGSNFAPSSSNQTTTEGEEISPQVIAKITTSISMVQKLKETYEKRSQEE